MMSRTQKRIYSAALLVIFTASCKGRTTPSSQLATGNDWSTYQKTRAQALESYKKQRPDSWDWFNERPLGFNGVPLVVLRGFMEWEQTSKIWKQDGTLSALGFPPRPGDYTKAGKVRDIKDRGLPFGFSWASDPNESNPKRQTLNAFFTCAGCHTGRVIVDGKAQMIPGGPSSEVEPQGYALLLKQTAQQFVFKFSPDAAINTPDFSRLSNFKAYLQKLRNDVFTGKVPPTFFFGGAVYEGKTYRGVTLDAAYYKKLALDELDKVLAPESYGEVMTSFVSSMVKIDITYNRLAATINYKVKDGKNPPPLHFSKPGQMDPWGIVQGNLVLNALRNDDSWLEFIDKYFAGKPEHDTFFAGNTQTDRKARYDQARADMVRNAGGLIAKKEQSEDETQKDIATAATWYAKVPANVDIRPLWLAREQYWANWDGNQQEAARTLASGVSAVGDPRAVDVYMHSAMNQFIADLPAPAYPFDVNMDAAKRGEAIFNAKCVSCHQPNNKELYDIGTDRNRLLNVEGRARTGMIAMVLEACVRDVKAMAGQPRQIDDFTVAPDWCLSKDSSGTYNDLYANINLKNGTRDGGVKLGYKSGPLHGVWASAPYLHNGSVPTIWHLLQKASARPTTFTRGNINYDQKNMGFVWDKEPTAADYPAGETRHFATFDTSLNGSSNSGHEQGTDLQDSEKWDLIEFLKTL